MARELLSDIIARNITALRHDCGLTQAAMAAKLGYSDKSVSKWERGDGTPDIACLKKIADMFGVTVDYLLTSEHAEETPLQKNTDSGGGKNADGRPAAIDHRVVTLITLVGVWLIAGMVFLITHLCNITFYLPFIVAIPVSAVVLVVFNALWGKKSWNFWLISLLCWGILLLICYVCRRYEPWLLMILGVPATLVVWLSCRIKVRSSHF